MRYTLDSMLPEKAFSPRLGRGFGAGGMTLEGGSGGGSSAPAAAAPTTTTVQNTNIPDYLQPYAETMLGATQQQLFNTQAQTPTYDASGNQTNTGAVDITGVKPYVPYSSNPADYVAGFSPMQQAAQQGAANLQVPGQYGQASDMAGASGLGAFGTVGQAGMYGQQGQAYGNLGAQAGQQAAGQSSMYGMAGYGQGQQGAQIGQSLGQQSQNTSQGPGSVASYMNPYLQNSLNPQLQLANQQYGIAGQQQQGAATSAGAFGGSRSALANSLNQQNQMLAQNQIIGQGYNQAYSNAQNQMNTANQAALAGNAQAQQGVAQGLQGAGQAGSLAMQGYGMGLQGAQTGLQGVGAQQAGYNLANTAASNLANIGTQQLGAQQNIIAAQSQAGQQQQTQQQNIINQAIQNYATAQQYPEQQLSFMNSMLRGLPTQQTTTATYQAAPSTVNQITGLGIAGLGAYNAFGGGAAAAGSDINLKENVVLLWRADNGMGIYEFEYKPEFKDHELCGHGKFIGYVAQEVEKFMPEAVFTMDNGYKAVDYNLVRGAA